MNKIHKIITAILIVAIIIIFFLLYNLCQQLNSIPTTISKTQHNCTTISHNYYSELIQRLQITSSNLYDQINPIYSKLSTLESNVSSTNLPLIKKYQP